MIRRSSSFPLAVFLALCSIAATACSSEMSPGGESSKKEAEAPGSVVATLEGKPITRAELDERAARQLYDVRKQMLEEMLTEQVLDKEAKAQGISREALLEKEVNSKVAEPTQAEIDQVWEANKARMPGRTKEESVPSIITFLKGQKAPRIQQSFLQGLRAKYKTEILLEAPRVAVSVDDDPAKGPADAPITIVEFSDFQCPYCSRAEAVVKQILENYKDKVRFVYRDFPLPMHPNATKASEAAQCAKEQGKYWEYHDALYADQSKLAEADLQATAERLGLKTEAFKTCLESGKYEAEVSKDVADGQKAGVGSTPSFFINGIPVVGAREYSTFAEIIDRELAGPKKK